VENATFLYRKGRATWGSAAENHGDSIVNRESSVGVFASSKRSPGVKTEIKGKTRRKMRKASDKGKGKF